MAKRNQIKLQGIKKIITKTVDEMVELKSQAYDDAISDRVWEWPRTTVRQNGEVVSSPRNIIDQEELIDSKVVVRRKNEAFFKWEAPHAVIVHEGATLKNGTDIPGRPWTKLAQERFNTQAFIADRLRKRLR